MTTLDAELHLWEAYRSERPSVHAVPLLEAAHAADQVALRLAAVNADASATAEVSLALLWRQLARGISRVVDGFFTSERCYLVLALETGGTATPAEARRMQLLQAVLGGVRQKNIAIDLNLAASTVAMNARLALTGMGVDCTPSRAHPLLILAARAVDEFAVALAQCSFFVGRDDRELRVIGMARPEQRLAPALPSAEREVIRCLVEGLSHAEIAGKRGTSARTVANQIGAVFRRLNVSGRNELVQRLLFARPLDPNSRDPALVSEASLLSESIMAPTQQAPESGMGRSAGLQSA
jgi:DNA-binding NarL/FixJ family response regulator